MVSVEGVDMARVLEDRLHHVKCLTRSVDSIGSNGSSGNDSRKHGLLRHRIRTDSAMRDSPPDEKEGIMAPRESAAHRRAAKSPGTAQSNILCRPT